jgi:hypothetical protein
MSEMFLDPGEMIQEKPIGFSEVTAALYDLDFNGSPEAITNAKAALLRARVGPKADEAWMIEPGNSLWQTQIDMLEDRLGINNQ